MNAARGISLTGYTRFRAGAQAAADYPARSVGVGVRAREHACADCEPPGQYLLVRAYDF